MGPKSKDKLRESFVDELRAFFGPRLKKVILFGSRARGDYSDESDYDFLLILDRVDAQAKNQVDELAGKMLWDYGAVITAIPLSEADLERMRFEPFIINIGKEGVAL